MHFVMFYTRGSFSMLIANNSFYST